MPRVCIADSEFGDRIGRARAALATLTTLGGVAVWMVIAAIIIALIFRLALFYIGTIRSAMGPL